jgi:thymidylate synthase ThyX
MKITAEIVADSVNMLGDRITTMQLEYPRFIHSEFMTHRAFSRNASSSRAIPVEKLVKRALDDPAFFVHVGTNRPGMQAGDEVDATTRQAFEDEWNHLGSIAAAYVRKWSEEYGIHKQVANRAMEPWHHIKVVVTATEWQNFFDLRCHPAAQPEMRALAEAMWIAREESRPASLGYGSWHLPYVVEDEYSIPIVKRIKISVARCARSSYMRHDGTPAPIEEDVGLHDRLILAKPIHASPAEHQACAVKIDRTIDDRDETRRSNFRDDWLQYRKLVEESALNSDPEWLSLAIEAVSGGFA